MYFEKKCTSLDKLPAEIMAHGKKYVNYIDI